MKHTIKKLAAQKHIALVAHDNCKDALINWCITNKAILTDHLLYGTGTTAHLLQQESQLDITPLLSGPMGGDQQLGAMIATQKIDVLVFFWDPLNAVPHDPDVKALMRIATVWNIPVAMNNATADFLIRSAHFSDSFETTVPDYQAYLVDRLDGDLSIE